MATQTNSADTLYIGVTPEYIEYKWSFYKKVHVTKVENTQIGSIIKTNSIAPYRLNAWPQVSQDWSLTLSNS